MKKVLFPILVVVLALGLTLPVAADTEDDLFVTDLMAGQTIDVGDVKVWNDGTNVYVKYEVDDPWLLTETHLFVGHTNPPCSTAPGQYPYGDDELDYEDSYLETIALTDIDSYSCPKGNKLVADGDTGVVEPCNDIYIAAHAVVVQPVDDCWEEVPVWQIGDPEAVDGLTGELTCYYDEFNYSGLVGHFYPSFANPYVISTNIYNDFPWNSNTSRSYATDFYVNWNGGLPFGGKLTASWSPGYTGSETKTMTADTGETTTIHSNGTVQTPGPTNWQGYPIQQDTLMINPADAGAHSIHLQHTAGNGTLWDWVLLEKPCEEDETAWAEGDRIRPNKNWAMYFEYHIQEPCVSGSVVNGGFELPDVAGRWYAYSSGTTDLEWTVEWHDGATTFETHTRPESAMLEVHNSIWPPHEGDQYVEMDADWSTDPGSNTFSGEPASVSISQHIATCPGETYTLEYAWSPRPGHSDNSIEVWWGGSLLTTHTADGSSNTDTSWTPTIHTGLSPTGTSTEIKFIEVGTADSFGMLLDAVSVVEG